MTTRQARARRRDRARCLLDLVTRMGGRSVRTRDRPPGAREWRPAPAWDFPDGAPASAVLWHGLAHSHAGPVALVWDGLCGPCGGPPECGPWPGDSGDRTITGG